jgi:hypothetical protein
MIAPLPMGALGRPFGESVELKDMKGKTLEMRGYEYGEHYGMTREERAEVRLVRLSDQLGRQVKLDGVARSCTRLPVTNAGYREA